MFLLLNAGGVDGKERSFNEAVGGVNHTQCDAYGLC